VWFPHETPSMEGASIQVVVPVGCPIRLCERVDINRSTFLGLTSPAYILVCDLCSRWWISRDCQKRCLSGDPAPRYRCVSLCIVRARQQTYTHVHIHGSDGLPASYGAREAGHFCTCCPARGAASKRKRSALKRSLCARSLCCSPSLSAMAGFWPSEGDLAASGSVNVPVSGFCRATIPFGVFREGFLGSGRRRG
jgi:hypothetical protein